MGEKILYLDPEDLREVVLKDFIYPNRATHYWSDCWAPGFYRDLAKAGFISTSLLHEENWILLPEIQENYAVLDWGNLHVSRKLSPFFRSDGLPREGIALRITRDPQKVLGEIAVYHGEKSWLSPPYRNLLSELARETSGNFELLGVELYAGDQIAAGELGYRIGKVYTSLTGFCHRENPRWNNYGKLQMVLLARELERSGYEFWNLGHPYMKYKLDLGARILSRQEFLRRWLPAVDSPGTNR